VLGAFPFFNFLLLGFGLGESKLVLRGKKTPMRWWHIGHILHDSANAFAIIVFYLSPFFLASILFLGSVLIEPINAVDHSNIVSKAVYGTNPFELGAIALGLARELALIVSENLFVFAPVLLLGFAFYFILPFALINYVRKRKIMAAFETEVIKRALNPKYFFYWLLFHFYLGVLFVVLSLLFFLPIVNFLLVGFILFVYSSTGFNLFTQLFTSDY